MRTERNQRRLAKKFEKAEQRDVRLHAAVLRLSANAVAQDVGISGRAFPAQHRREATREIDLRSRHRHRIDCEQPFAPASQPAGFGRDDHVPRPGVQQREWRSRQREPAAQAFLVMAANFRSAEKIG